VDRSISNDTWSEYLISKPESTDSGDTGQTGKMAQSQTGIDILNIRIKHKPNTENSIRKRIQSRKSQVRLSNCLLAYLLLEA